MKQVTYIGDIHGKWNAYSKIIAQHENTVQVGDFGIGFPNGVKQSHIEELMQKGNHRFIRGNHDNPALCAESKVWIPDGTYEEETGTLYVGGAFSIDRFRLTPDVNWWHDEELSHHALSDIVELYERVKPRIVVSHDCPDNVAFDSFYWYNGHNESRTRSALQLMFGSHKPEAWIFGHWHSSLDEKIQGTRFICLNELETVTLEV